MVKVLLSGPSAKRSKGGKWIPGHHLETWLSSGPQSINVWMTVLASETEKGYRYLILSYRYAALGKRQG